MAHPAQVQRDAVRDLASTAVDFAFIAYCWVMERVNRLRGRSTGPGGVPMDHDLGYFQVSVGVSS